MNKQQTQRMERVDDSFNECSSLNENGRMKQLLKEHEHMDTVEMIWKYQAQLQEKVSEEKPYVPQISKLKTCGERLDYIKFALHNLTKESLEFIDAMGGMSNGVKKASSIDKPWKTDYLELRNKDFSEMSKEDLDEIKFEFIDMVFFLTIAGLAIGITPEEVKGYYLLKNIENLQRQENGY